MNDTEAINLNTLRIWSHVTCVCGRAAGAAWCTSSHDCRRCTAVQSLLLLSAADGWQMFGVRAHARCHHHHRRCIPLVSGSTLSPPQSSTSAGIYAHEAKTTNSRNCVQVDIACECWCSCLNHHHRLRICHMVTSHPPPLEPLVSGDQPPSSGAHLVNLEDVSATSCIHILQRWRYENAIFLKAKNLTFLLILIDSSLNYESSSERQSAVTEHSYGWPTQPKDEQGLPLPISQYFIQTGDGLHGFWISEHSILKKTLALKWFKRELDPSISRWSNQVVAINEDRPWIQHDGSQQGAGGEETDRLFGSVTLEDNLLASFIFLYLIYYLFVLYIVF